MKRLARPTSRARFTPRARIEATLAAIALAALLAGGVMGAGDDANIAFFIAWCAALALLVALALRLPAQIPGPKLVRRAAGAGLVVAAAGVALLASVALYRHDVHFDLTPNRRFTAPEELRTVVAQLGSEVRLTYFYNAGDDAAWTAKDALAVLARGQPRLIVRAIDLDKEPGVAREFGVRAYNTIVVETGGRRVQVDNTVDLRQVAFAILRAQREGGQTVCFVTGHGEPLEGPGGTGHAHLSHEETLQSRAAPGEGDVVEGPPAGLDRLRLALAAFGFGYRPLTLATLAAVPAECTILAEIGPRAPWAPAEASSVAAYLGAGGRLLLALDPASPVAEPLAGLLATLALSLPPGQVIDPLNHYGTAAEKVAVPYYPPHPITDGLALTIFPAVRPIRLAPPPGGVEVMPLMASSQDSYLQGTPEAKGAMALAVAARGVWPGAAGEAEFRLVLFGSSGFLGNEYFPAVSNGALAVGALRWLAGDAAAPGVRPPTYSVPEIALTGGEMRAVFLLVEGVLPGSVLLAWFLVWRRRR